MREQLTLPRYASAYIDEPRYPALTRFSFPTFKRKECSLSCFPTVVVILITLSVLGAQVGAAARLNLLGILVVGFRAGLTVRGESGGLVAVVWGF